MAKAFFGLLKLQKDEIERELGYRAGVGGTAVTATAESLLLNDLDPEDEADWPRQHEWLAKRLNDMHRVFAPRVRALDLEQPRSEAE